MKRISIKMLAGVLSLTMVLLTACSGEPSVPAADSSTPQQVAMGRYVETPYDLPKAEGIQGIYHGVDGSPQVAAYTSEADDWVLLSAGEDMQWVPQPKTLGELSGLNEIEAMTVTPQGGMLLVGQTISDELRAQLDAFYASGGGYSEELVFPPLQLIELLPDGTKREIPLPKLEDSNISMIEATDSGDIVLLSYNTINYLERSTGAIINTFDIGKFITSIAVCQNKLAVMCEGTALVYDLQSGEQVESIDNLGVSPTSEDVMVSSTEDNRAVVATGEDDAFYFANQTGLYRRAANGGVVERLMDGSLVSLGSPTMQPYDMLVLPDGIMMLLMDTLSRDILLKKYSFDPTVPTLPDKELRIYSLGDNKTIRQAISSYQLANPDTHVVLEVGTGEATTAEAIRTLNTQLLAGKGPDVLLLDDMPLGSYIEKNILMPLGEDVTVGMLPNLAVASHSSDGKLYAVPTRVLLPMMAGDKALMEGVNDLPALAKLVAAMQQKSPSAKRVLQNCGGHTMLNTLYPIFADTLYTNGKPDVQKLTVFLEAIGEIAKLQDPAEAFITDASAMATLDIAWTTVEWQRGGDVMVLGQAKGMRDYAAAATTIGEKPDCTVSQLSPATGTVYIPRGMLGVNSNSPNKEAALAFIATALSAPVQVCEFEDGFPVSKDAVEAMLVPRTAPQNHLMTYGLTGEDGETLIFTVLYPTQQYLTLLQQWLTGLDTPSVVSQTVLELLRNESTGYFMGDVSLGDTMSVLSQKLTLQQTE